MKQADTKPIRVLFMGRKTVAAECLEYLYTSPGFHVVGVLCDSHLEVSPTRDMAVKLNLKVLNFSTITDMIQSSKLEFDLGISMLYWRKIKGVMLDHPPLGIINFHPAPLPDMKGFGGYNIAILDRLEEFGVTAHYMDVDIDTGPIIQVLNFSIEPEAETAKSLETKAVEHLGKQFRSVMPSLLLSPDYKLQTLPNEGGKYTTREELNELKKVLPTDDVHLKIRAFWFPPYEGAMIRVNGGWFTLVNLDLLQSLSDPATSSLYTPAAQAGCGAAQKPGGANGTAYPPNN